MIYDNIVIGSGISALGCVVGLLESNKKILCIDGSDNTLESFKNIDNEEIVFDNDNLPLKRNSITAKFVNNVSHIKFFLNFMKCQINSLPSLNKFMKKNK